MAAESNTNKLVNNYLPTDDVHIKTSMSFDEKELASVFPDLKRRQKMNESFDLNNSKFPLNSVEEGSGVSPDFPIAKRQKGDSETPTDNIDLEAEEAYHKTGIDLQYAQMKAKETVTFDTSTKLPPLSINPNEFRRFGDAYPQVFQFGKHLIRLFCLFVLAFGIFSLYINISTIYCLRNDYDSYFGVDISPTSGLNTQSAVSSNDSFLLTGETSVGTALKLNPISCFRSWATDLSAVSRFPNSLSYSDLSSKEAEYTLKETIILTSLLIVFMLGLIFSRSRFLERASKSQNQFHPCDFALKIEGLPKDASTEDIKKHFELEGDEVLEVIQVDDLRDLMKEIEKYHFLEEWASKRGKKFGDLAHQLELSRKKIQNAQKSPTGVAFVTFATQASCDKVFNIYGRRICGFCLRRDARPFKETESVPRAAKIPYPIDILWENLGFSHSQRVTRKFFGILVTGFIIAAIQAMNIASILLIAHATTISASNLQFFSSLLSILIILGNLLIEWAVEKAVLYEKHHSKIERATARIERTYLCQILNSSIIGTIFLINQGYPGAYTNSSLSFLTSSQTISRGIVTTLTIQEITYEAFAMFFFGVLITCLKTYNLSGSLLRREIEKKALAGVKVGISQQEVNRIFQNPEFDLEKVYTSLLSIVIFALTTCVWAPINLVCCWIYLVVIYWIYKKQLLYQSSKPEYAGHEYGLAVFTTIKLGVLLTCVVACASSGFKFIYSCAAVSYANLYQTLGSGLSMATLVLSLCSLACGIVFYFLPSDILASIFVFNKQSYNKYKVAATSQERYDTLFRNDADCLRNSYPLQNIN